MKYQLRTIPNTHISVSYINRQISSVIYNIFELSKKWNKVATSWLENSYKKLGLQRSFFRWYLWYCVPFDSYKNIERFSFEKVFKVNKSADKIRYFHEIMSKQNPVLVVIQLFWLSVFGVAIICGLSLSFFDTPVFIKDVFWNQNCMKCIDTDTNYRNMIQHWNYGLKIIVGSDI